MLLNNLQCPGQPPNSKKFYSPNVNSAKVEKLCFSLITSLPASHINMIITDSNSLVKIHFVINYKTFRVLDQQH